MVNFHDPKVIQADAVALEHFVLILDGIFLWEFFTAIDFDWNYLASKKKFKLPIFLYLSCRVCSLGVVICNFINDNVAHRINCQLFLSWNLILVATSFACASVLIAIRVIAIWNYNFLVTAVTVGMCITNTAFFLYCIAMGRAKWSNESRACFSPNDEYGRTSVTVTTITDIAQLIIMLIGLLRTGTRGERQGLLGHLYVQGLLWLVAAIIVETPTAVLMLLNLNAQWNSMFQMFSLYSMIICATRMFRGLILYDMDIYGYSEGPKVNSTLRFATLSRERMATGTRDPGLD